MKTIYQRLGKGAPGNFSGLIHFGFFDVQAIPVPGHDFTSHPTERRASNFSLDDTSNLLSELLRTTTTKQALVELTVVTD